MLDQATLMLNTNNAARAREKARPAPRPARPAAAPHDGDPARPAPQTRGGLSSPDRGAREREKADAAAQLSAARAQAALQPWGPYPVWPAIRRLPARCEMAGKLPGV